MQISIIPAWLSRKLGSSGLPLSTVFDTNELSSILTTEDLFFYWKANVEVSGLRDFSHIRQDFPFQDGSLILDMLNPSDVGVIQADLSSSSIAVQQNLVYADPIAGTGNVCNGNSYDTVVVAPGKIVLKVKLIPECGSQRTESMKGLLGNLIQYYGEKETQQTKLFNSFIGFIG